jgi:hypothetical protein
MQAEAGGISTVPAILVKRCWLAIWTSDVPSPACQVWVALQWTRCPSDSSSVPVPVQRALNTAVARSDPATQTDTRGCQKPVRLKIHRLDASSAAATESVLQRSVATMSASVRNS